MLPDINAVFAFRSGRLSFLLHPTQDSLGPPLQSAIDLGEQLRLDLSDPSLELGVLGQSAVLHLAQLAESRSGRHRLRLPDRRPVQLQANLTTRSFINEPNSAATTWAQEPGNPDIPGGRLPFDR
jgi:hypothetical protein